MSVGKPYPFAYKMLRQPEFKIDFKEVHQETLELGTYLDEERTEELIDFLQRNKGCDITLKYDDDWFIMEAIKWERETLEEAKQRAQFEIKRQQGYLKEHEKQINQNIQMFQRFLDENP
jgi:hydroxymethylpyrimidine pyrophosphatase-like HAD family hydrolase